LSITLLYGCCQIETSVRDLGAVRTFMIDVLGGGPIEQLLARQISDLIPGDAYDVDHIDCGEVVFQINQPSPSMTYNGRKSVHQAYLDRIGACVTNLNFFVDDHEHARALLASMGAETLIEGPSSAARALADYGPENTRAGADERPFLFMGSRRLIGLDLEIMEPNFLHFTRQSVQYPAFVHPRPRTGDGNLLLDRLIIAVPDLHETHAAFVKLFAPASRSKPYDIRSGGWGRSFRIGLGGIEIEYCQPRSADGELAEFLARTGRGVVAIAFGAQNPHAILDRCRTHGTLAPEEVTDQFGAPCPSPRWRISSRDLLGFDVVLEKLDEPALA
jgi:hypothetical protein